MPSMQVRGFVSGKEVYTNDDGIDGWHCPMCEDQEYYLTEGQLEKLDHLGLVHSGGTVCYDSEDPTNRCPFFEEAYVDLSRMGNRDGEVPSIIQCSIGRCSSYIVTRNITSWINKRS